jgi:hypothetical protein
VYTLGSEAEVPTILSAGIDPDLAIKIAEHKRQIAAQLSHIRRAREELLVLLRHEKQWTPRHRARSRELSAELQQRSAKVTRLEAQRQRLLAEGDAPENPTIHVERALYGGVTVVISGRAAQFGQEYAGPLTITRETASDHDALILTDARSGESTTLPSSDFTEEYIDLIGRPSGDHRPADGAAVAHFE